MATEGFTIPPILLDSEDDSRYVTVGRDWAWFINEWPCKLRQKNWELRGFSFCQKPNGWLLTVRISREEIPLVVFINKIDPIGCIATLRRKVLEGTCTYFPDHYA